MVESVDDFSIGAGMHLNEIIAVIDVLLAGRYSVFLSSEGYYVEIGDCDVLVFGHYICI